MRERLSNLEPAEAPEQDFPKDGAVLWYYVDGDGWVKRKLTPDQLQYCLDEISD